MKFSRTTFLMFVLPVVTAALAHGLACSPQGLSNAFFSNQSSADNAQGTTQATTISDGATTDIPVDFGPNVLVFDSKISVSTIQNQLDKIYKEQSSDEFSKKRYAYFFKPGSYNLDIQIGYYTAAYGLGMSPDAVDITGAVRSKAGWNGGVALINFWRSAENLAVTPTQDGGTNIWAVSQGAPLRRMHIKGPLALSDGGYASGGYIADSKIDGIIDSGTQQQFFVRNSSINTWTGGTWNMFFLGVNQAPTEQWPQSPYLTVDESPSVREKPYIAVDASGNYVVMVPALKIASKGHGWESSSAKPRMVNINHFYIAQSAKDTADTINAALSKGLNLILTPGIYSLDKSIQVSRANTIVLGLGMATLQPTSGTTAMTVADVDGVSIAGILFDASEKTSTSLLVVGSTNANNKHAINPIVLSDIFCRVGGAGPGKVDACITVNADDTIIDHAWLWRADHGNNVDWNENTATTGIIVNAANVVAYGLFVEHFQGYQTLWNGNGGRTFFYQSEIPYDVPNQALWTHDGIKGYASYKVADSVTSHKTKGAGAYCVFYNNVELENAFETPSSSDITMNNIFTIWLGVDASSSINHIINGTGNKATQNNRQQRTPN